jgi:hypothetical protein
MRILLIGFFRATDIMIHVPSLFLAKHSLVAALAERTDHCKAEPQDRLPFQPTREANIANSFTAEALL